jgi:hypothetical protein
MKSAVQQVGVKFYISNIVAWKLYNIKFTNTTQVKQNAECT